MPGPTGPPRTESKADVPVGFSSSRPLRRARACTPPPTPLFKNSRPVSFLHRLLESERAALFPSAF